MSLEAHLFTTVWGAAALGFFEDQCFPLEIGSVDHRAFPHHSYLEEAFCWVLEARVRGVVPKAHDLLAPSHTAACTDISERAFD